jgi:hypothetical protein
MRYFLLMMAFICFHAGSRAQKAMVYDTSSVEKRHFNQASIKMYKEDEDFNYDRVVEPPESMIAKAWDWLWGKFVKMLSTREGERAFFTFLFVIAFLILLYFIFRVTGMSNEGLFGKDNRAGDTGFSVTDENIHEINFEEAIRESVLQKNFRLAVRLLYLQSLKNLTDKGLIKWQINKTNIIYEQELKERPFRPLFHSLTAQFENNWYGKVPIDEKEFEDVRTQFMDFNRQIQ